MFSWRTTPSGAKKHCESTEPESCQTAKNHHLLLLVLLLPPPPPPLPSSSCMQFHVHGFTVTIVDGVLPTPSGAMDTGNVVMAVMKEDAVSWYSGRIVELVHVHTT